MSTKEITIAMASFPPRRTGLVKVVNQMLPQCTRMCLYLNGYTAIPEELPKDDKLVIILAGEGMSNPDLGSQGKMHWIGQFDDYYLTIDDDINYPVDYADYMVKNVDKYEGKAIVGMHGGIFRIRMGGCFPPRGFAKDHRTLYPYDTRVARDIPVHILGCGVMACNPKVLGLTREVCCGPIHSGDDEDIAIWAQKNRVALIRLVGQDKWITPNDHEWVKQPLHRRMDYIQKADNKLKAWNSWVINRVPVASSDVAMPRPSAMPPGVPPARLKAPTPSSGFGRIKLDPESLAFCHKILSSDALGAIVVDRIKNRVPTSVIRTSDGERALMMHAKGAALAPFLCDPMWLKRYGLTGANLKKVGEDLLEAGNHADFLGCTISGLFLGHFKVHHLFPERKQFIDVFFPQLWSATDRVGDILRAGRVLVLHREQATIVPELSRRYDLLDVMGATLSSWGDHERLLREVPGMGADLILMSGGPSGKPFAVRLAQQASAVVLDVGEAMQGHWVK